MSIEETAKKQRLLKFLTFLCVFDGFMYMELVAYCNKKKLLLMDPNRCELPDDLSPKHFPISFCVFEDYKEKFKKEINTFLYHFFKERYICLEDIPKAIVTREENNRLSLCMQWKKYNFHEMEKAKKGIRYKLPDYYSFASFFYKRDIIASYFVGLKKFKDTIVSNVGNHDRNAEQMEFFLKILARRYLLEKYAEEYKKESKK